MDGGLFNSPRSTDRRAVNRPAVAERKPEASPALVSTHKQGEVRHHTLPTKNQRSSKVGMIIIAAIVLLLVGGIVWYFMQRGSGVASSIDPTKYQAVFFTNGQVYFGKLSVLNSEYMKLTNIYYLQNQSTTESDSSNPQESSNSSSQVQLIKLGEEVHGPEDEMVISKDQMLFFENLKNDGQVSQKIKDSKK